MQGFGKVGVLSVGLLMLGAVSTAQAANLVTNGSFETVTGSSVSTEFGASHSAVQLTGWTATGYSFVFFNAKDTALAFGGNNPVTFWGSDNGGSGARVASPDLGNFVAIDPVVKAPGSISQEINGLVAGQKYDLTFDWAGAQQKPYSGYGTCHCTQDGWDVSMGGTLIDSVSQNDPNHTFTAWNSETVQFTATGISELLKFLSIGGPSGTQPPFSLLDGVSIVEVPHTQNVPEPLTLSLLGAGVAGAVAMRRRRKVK